MTKSATLAACAAILLASNCAMPPNDARAMAAPQPAPTPTPSSTPTPDVQQLQRTFVASRSSQVEYAKTKGGQSFYMAIEAVNLSPALDNNKCADKSFLSWIRRFFKTESATTALVVSISGPQDDSAGAFTVPLFEVAKQESPVVCRTSITNQVITPFYLTDSGHPFQLTATIKAQKDANVTGAQSLVSTAKGVLDFAGGSAGLIKIVEGATFANAARTVDTSLGSLWSSTDQREVKFDMRAWPTDGDWTNFKDQVTFSVVSLNANSGGIQFDAQLSPSVLLRPVYRVSLFGDGLGEYYAPERILITRLLRANGSDFKAVLLAGLGSVTIENAGTMTDSGAMRDLCNRMRTTFSKFLTDDDALAARYSVLKLSTPYFYTRRLQQESGCLSETDATRLILLNPAYDVTTVREEPVDRGPFVQARMDLVVNALLNVTPASLAAVVADPVGFQLTVAPDVQSIFPARTDGKSWGDVIGKEALDQLAASGSFRVGCAKANVQQNLGSIAAVVLNKSTNKSAAMLIDFTIGDPAAGTTAEADAAKVRIKSMRFYSIGLVGTILQRDDWARGCVLL